jgi:hypothetical protein
MCAFSNSKTNYGASFWIASFLRERLSQGLLWLNYKIFVTVCRNNIWLLNGNFDKGVISTDGTRSRKLGQARSVLFEIYLRLQRFPAVSGWAFFNSKPNHYHHYLETRSTSAFLHSWSSITCIQSKYVNQYVILQSPFGSHIQYILVDLD